MAKLSARGRTILARLTRKVRREELFTPYTVIYHRCYMSDGKILTKTAVEGGGRSGYIVAGNYKVETLDEIIERRTAEGWEVER